MDLKDSQQRIYFSLIQSAGSWNRYQLQVFFISLGVSIIESSQIFILPYLFQQNPYHCHHLDHNLCEELVCSLLPQERKLYRPQQPFASLANSFTSADFRCEYKSALTFFSTLIFISSILCFLSYTFFTEHLGRKKSLLLSMFLILFGNLFILLNTHTQSIILIIAGIFFTYSGTEVAYQLIYCYSVEIVKEQKRIAYMNLLNSIYGLGMIMNSILFFTLKDWFTIYLVVYIPLIIVTILAIIILVQKTPLDLLATENPQEILAALERIANTNRVKLSITLDEVQQIQDIYYDNISHAEYFSALDLLKFKSLRNSTIPLVFLNFFTIYLFYSPSAISNSKQKDLYANGISDGISFSISVIITYLFMAYCPRKLASFGLFSLSLICEGILYQMKDIFTVQYNAIYFLFRLLISSNFCCIFFINYETYPTQIRAVGAMFVYAIGSASGIVQPIISEYCQQSNINNYLPFIIVSLLGLITSFFLKQTFGVAPPETIEELAIAKFQTNG